MVVHHHCSMTMQTTSVFDGRHIAAAAAAGPAFHTRLLVCSAWALLHAAAAVIIGQEPPWRGAALRLSHRALSLGHQPTRAALRRGGATRTVGGQQQTVERSDVISLC
jgi:hypothetical protein